MKKSKIFNFPKLILFIILSIYSLNSSFCKTINDLFKFKKQIIFKEPLFYDYSSKIKILNDSVYLMNSSRNFIKKNELINIYIYRDSFELYYGIPCPQMDVLNNFVLGENGDIFVLFQHYIYRYIVEGQELVLKSKYNLKNNFSDIVLTDSFVVLLNDCFGCTNPGVKTLILNRDLEYISGHSYENRFGFQLSNLKPNRRVNVNNQNIIVSNILDYKIEFYDLIDNHKINEIILNKNFNNDSLQLNILDNQNYDYWNVNNKLYDSLFLKIGRIELVDFINDSTIMICYSYYDEDLKNIYRFSYDIWCYKSNFKKWELISHDLKNMKQNPDDIPAKVDNMGGTFLNNYFFSNDMLVVPKILPFDITKNEEFKKMTNDSFNLIISEFRSKNKRRNLRNYVSLFIYEYFPKNE